MSLIRQWHWTGMTVNINTNMGGLPLPLDPSYEISASDQVSIITCTRLHYSTHHMSQSSLSVLAMSAQNSVTSFLISSINSYQCGKIQFYIYRSKQSQVLSEGQSRMGSVHCIPISALTLGNEKGIWSVKSMCHLGPQRFSSGTSAERKLRRIS